MSRCEMALNNRKFKTNAQLNTLGIKFKEKMKTGKWTES